MWSLTRHLASSALSDSDRSIGVCLHLSGQACQFSVALALHGSKLCNQARSL